MRTLMTNVLLKLLDQKLRQADPHQLSHLPLCIQQYKPQTKYFLSLKNQESRMTRNLKQIVMVVMMLSAQLLALQVALLAVQRIPGRTTTAKKRIGSRPFECAWLIPVDRSYASHWLIVSSGVLVLLFVKLCVPQIGCVQHGYSP